MKDISKEIHKKENFYALGFFYVFPDLDDLAVMFDMNSKSGRFY